MSARRLAIIEAQNDLARIDREWELERRRYLSRDRRGAVEPSLPRTLLISAAMAFIAGLWLGLIDLPIFDGRPSPQSLSPHADGIGWGFLAFSLIILAVGWWRANRFQAARLRYRNRRRQALKTLGRTR